MFKSFKTNAQLMPAKYVHVGTLINMISNSLMFCFFLQKIQWNNWEKGEINSVKDLSMVLMKFCKSIWKWVGLIFCTNLMHCWVYYFIFVIALWLVKRSLLMLSTHHCLQFLYLCILLCSMTLSSNNILLVHTYLHELRNSKAAHNRPSFVC